MNKFNRYIQSEMKIMKQGIVIYNAFFKALLYQGLRFLWTYKIPKRWVK